jgi:hypothetical protein
MSEPNAKVAYDASPLNVHRRHAQSVTHALDAERHVGEITRIHNVAAKLFPLPKAVLDKQTAYQAAVTVQLGGVSLVQATSDRAQSKKTTTGRKSSVRKKTAPNA